MSSLRGNWQASLMSICVVMITACSTVSENPTGIPEIQGVWRYSEGKFSQQGSLTYEFQQDQFRVSGPPNTYAYGKYNFVMSEHGGYQVELAPEESQGFEIRTLQVQPTGGRILLIDRQIYRRILRH